jgi:hypothetical protein
MTGPEELLESSKLSPFHLIFYDYLLKMYLHIATQLLDNPFHYISESNLKIRQGPVLLKKKFASSLIKGIVSRDFGVLFLISSNRYQPPNRAG